MILYTLLIFYFEQFYFKVLVIVVVSVAYAQEHEIDGVVAGSTADAIAHFIPSGEQRQGKNLVGVFPFNQDPSTHAHHGHHDEHHGAHHEHHNAPADTVLLNREARQRNRNRNRQGGGGRGGGGRGNLGSSGGSAESHGGAPTFDDVAAAGERCIEKIEMTEVTEYDDAVECKHSYSRQCHQSYVTDYKPAQKQQCDEEFVKNCHIEYKKTASQETVRKCITPQICSGEGPNVCRTVTTTACETKVEKHEVDDDIVNCRTEFIKDCRDETQGYATTTSCKQWPTVKCDKINQKVVKATPITECSTKPIQVCGAEGCLLEAGEPECVDEVQTVINPVSFYSGFSERMTLIN